MAKGNKGFGALLTDSLDDEVEGEDAAPAESIMASRSQTLSRLASGKVVTDRTEFVNPAQCRPWRLHNRDVDHLDEESCRDLIDAFLAAKKQRIPAIVRRLRDDPEHDFEIIAGVRRWWTVQWLRDHNHPEFDYLITIQSLTDEEAFRVSDIENRSRKDISDWERAHDYKAALEEFYDGSLSQMAEHLNISVSWLSRMLDVARLPDAVVAGFADRHDITVRIARELKPLVKGKAALTAMANEAEQLATARAKSGEVLSGPDTAKRLVAATQVPARKTRAVASGETIHGKAGEPILTVTRSRRSNEITIKVLERSKTPKNEVLAAIEELI